MKPTPVRVLSRLERYRRDISLAETEVAAHMVEQNALIYLSALIDAEVITEGQYGVYSHTFAEAFRSGKRTSRN